MSPFDFNLRHLRALAAICRCGTISGAATLVDLSQPAVTQGIAGIEAQTRMRLFDRRANGMTPTAAGKVFSGRAEAAGAALAEGFRAVGRGSTGFVRVERLVTMTQVRALLALAQAGSYVAAARAIGLSQPSLHRAIRDVEQLSHVQLVQRRGRGVALTPAGTRLARAFRLAISEIESGLEELAGIAGDAGGRVRIGAMPLARARLLPVAAARFHARNPAMTVEIVEGSHAELIEPLRDGALDFLIGALRDPDPGPDVAQEVLFEDRLMVICGSHHPLATVRAPTLAQLSAYPWVIAREGTPLRAYWKAMFQDHGATLPAAPIVSGSAMTIRTLLREGDFLTLLSPEQVGIEIAMGMLKVIADPLVPTRRAIGLTTRRDWHPSPAPAAFIALLRTITAEPTLQEIE